MHNIIRSRFCSTRGSEAVLVGTRVAKIHTRSRKQYQFFRVSRRRKQVYRNKSQPRRSPETFGVSSERKSSLGTKDDDFLTLSESVLSVSENWRKKIEKSSVQISLRWVNEE